MKDDARFELRNDVIEKLLRDIGHSIAAKVPDGYGFTLLIFGYTNNEMFYISAAERQTMIAAMREFIQKHGGKLGFSGDVVGNRKKERKSHDAKNDAVLFSAARPGARFTGRRDVPHGESRRNPGSKLRFGLRL